MSDNIKHNRQLIICLVLIISQGILRYYFNQKHIAYQGIITVIFLSIYFQWIFSIKKRFMHSEMQRTLLYATALMVFWIIIRTIKYSFTSGTFITNILWYLYYIPFIMIPMQMFLATLYMSKSDVQAVSEQSTVSEQYYISKKWYLIYIPAVIIIIGILTNNLHELAFHFKDSSHHNYSYGPFYFAAMTTICLSILGILINAFYTCARQHFIKHLWLTVLVLAAGILYLYLYINPPGNTRSMFQHFFEMPEFTCIFMIAFWESLVSTHMIPSNTNHNLFFKASSIQAGLTDEHYNIILRAAAGIEPDYNQLRNASLQPVIINNDIMLKCRPVKGGHFYWTEDIAELNRLNRELEDTGNYLAEEHAMLDAAVRLEESKRHTMEQNRLYDKINHTLKPQLDIVSGLLENLPDDVGGCLLALRSYLTQKNSDRDQLVSLWNTTISVLKQETTYDDQSSSRMSALKEAARSVDVELIIHGDIPPDTDVEDIITTAIHECLTNTVKHADGTMLEVTIAESEGRLNIRLSNNGKTPDAPIVEKGGLKILRSMVEMHTGTMLIDVTPVFTLNINLPYSYRKIKDNII